MSARVSEKQIEARITVLNDYMARHGIGLRVNEECCGGVWEFSLSEIKGRDSLICRYDTRRRAFQALERFFGLLCVTEIKDIAKVKQIFDWC